MLTRSCNRHFETIHQEIAASVPVGEYLLRVEHIAIHSATLANGPHFYVSYSQLNVTGDGAAVPKPLVFFTGAYKAKDSGIMMDIYSKPVGKSHLGICNPSPYWYLSRSHRTQIQGRLFAKVRWC